MAKNLERMASRTRKKATKSARDKHPAYLRDIKSLALSLYHCLSTRQNLIYYTSDADPVSLFLKWLNSMTMWMTLGRAVLPKLGSVDRTLLMQGGAVELVLDVVDFAQRKYKMFLGMLDDRRKTEACRFTIKHWNQVEKFDEDIFVWFDDVVANVLSNAHGPLSCYFTKNSEFGNWLHMHYHWPPAEGDEGRLRVRVTRKSIINSSSSAVPADEHDRRCRYRQEDASDKIGAWSQFF